MVLGSGTVSNCSRRGIVWTWGSSNLLAEFCEEWNRLGEGIVSAGTVNVFKTIELDHHLRNVRGIYKHFLFPLPMAIHDNIFMDGSW